MGTHQLSQHIFLASVLLITFTASPEAAASGLVLNSAVWTLAVDQDFTQGDAPSLYRGFCGQQGAAVGGANNNNFSAQNVYWANGALTLKFENRVNTSCTGVTRDYAGAGLMGTGVLGVSPYATLWPVGTVTPSCGWGAEDDFFEQSVLGPTGEFQTYHYWTPAPACTHRLNQSPNTIPNIATTYHNYAVVRNGSAEFFVDGVAQPSTTGQLISTTEFQNYPMSVQMGVGGYNAYPPNNSQLPAYVYIRHIRIWYKT